MSESKCASGCGREATGTGIIPVRPANSGRTTIYNVVERPLCDECRAFFGRQIVRQNEAAMGVIQEFSKAKLADALQKIQADMYERGGEE